MSEGGQVAVRADEDVVAVIRARGLEQRVRELERLWGRKTEAFVKTLRRDYARIYPRPDSLTVLNQLPVWIEDYNETTHTGACGCAHLVSSSRANRNQPRVRFNGGYSIVAQQCVCLTRLRLDVGEGGYTWVIKSRP